MLGTLINFCLELELASSHSCPSFNAINGDSIICSDPNSTDCQITIRFNSTIDQWIILSGECAVNCQNKSYTKFGVMFKDGCCPKVEGEVQCPSDGRVFSDLRPLLLHRPAPTPSTSTAVRRSTGFNDPSPTISVDAPAPTTPDPSNPDIILSEFIIYSQLCIKWLHMI